MLLAWKSVHLPRQCFGRLARVKFVDHAGTAELRAKYANDPAVALSSIVQIDAVWGDNTLAECFPNDRFDFVIASHVIEHVPDMIGWLNEVADVLSPNGYLILALPDRRYSFDLLRRETTLTDLIDAYFRGSRRPTPGQVFDVNANSVAHDHTMAWFAPPLVTPPRYASREWALKQAHKAQAGSYIDVHCSVFTARSLLELLDGLLELNLIRYRLDRFYVAPVGSAEMSLVLRRQPKGAEPEAARLSIREMLNSGKDTEGLDLDTTSEADPQTFALRRRIAEVEHALATMQASLSWRITRPARTFLSLARAWHKNFLQANRPA